MTVARRCETTPDATKTHVRAEVPSYSLKKQARSPRSGARSANALEKYSQRCVRGMLSRHEHDPSLRWHLVVGALQGLAVWMLYEAVRNSTWPATSPPAFGAAAYATIAAPLALYLLWFATLAIVFVNAAFQGGDAATPYPRWLATSIRWAWLTMPAGRTALVSREWQDLTVGGEPFTLGR